MQWHQFFLDNPLPDADLAEFEQLCEISIQKQIALEAIQEQRFDDYLNDFFEQYRGVKL